MQLDIINKAQMYDHPFHQNKCASLFCISCTDYLRNFSHYINWKYLQHEENVVDFYAICR